MSARQAHPLILGWFFICVSFVMSFQICHVIPNVSWLMYCDKLSEFMKNLQYMPVFLASSASLLCSVRMVFFFEHLQAGHDINPEVQQVLSLG